MKSKVNGIVLKAIRIVNDLTIVQTADVLGVSQPFYTRIEKNEKNISDERLMLFSNYFNISPETIMYLSKNVEEDNCNYQDLLFEVLRIYNINYIDNDQTIKSYKDKDDMIAFLKNERKNTSITMNQLAKGTGVSHTTISRIENGQTSPTLEMFIKYADYLGCELKLVKKEKIQEEQPKQLVKKPKNNNKGNN